MRRDLIGVDGGSLGGGQACGSEDLLHHRVLPPAVLVDVRNCGTDLPLDGSVLLAQARVGAQDVPDGEVVAKRQRVLNDDIGVRRGQALRFLKCPPQRNAELAQRRESQPARTCDAAATSCPSTTMSQSITGLAASPGTAVLPTCSMDTTGTPAASMASAYTRRNSSNRIAQTGSYSTTRITSATYAVQTRDAADPYVCRDGRVGRPVHSAKRFVACTRS